MCMYLEERDRKRDILWLRVSAGSPLPNTVLYRRCCACGFFCQPLLSPRLPACSTSATFDASCDFLPPRRARNTTANAAVLFTFHCHAAVLNCSPVAGFRRCVLRPCAAIAPTCVTPVETIRAVPFSTTSSFRYSPLTRRHTYPSAGHRSNGITVAAVCLPYLP